VQAFTLSALLGIIPSLKARSRASVSFEDIHREYESVSMTFGRH